MNLDTIHQQFHRVCQQIEPLAMGRTLLLGCSGGGDSMALLELMATAAPDRQWQLVVAHLDHAQRDASGDEAAFVRARAASLNLKYVGERFTGERGLSEEALRGARYGFFARAMRLTGAHALVLAHQADDRAETFVMRLIAGAGPTGLGSIRSVDEVAGIAVVRPLLTFRRDELRDHLRARRLTWIDDPANDDERFKRVWVRRRVLPLLDERAGRDAVHHIVRASELIEEEADALESAAQLMLDVLTDSPGAPRGRQLNLDHPFWKQADAALRRRLMRAWLIRLRSGPHPPGYEAVEEALKFADRAATGTVLRTIESIHLRKERGALVVEPATREST